MEKYFEIATNISTPLMLAGFSLAVFFGVIKKIISKDIFPELTKQMSSSIFNSIINKIFFLALFAMILGFIGYIINSPVLVHSSKDLTEIKNDFESEQAITIYNTSSDSYLICSGNTLQIPFKVNLFIISIMEIWEKNEAFSFRITPIRHEKVICISDIEPFENEYKTSALRKGDNAKFNFRGKEYLFELNNVKSSCAYFTLNFN